MTKLEAAINRTMKLSQETRRVYLRRVADFVAFAGAREADWTPEALERWRDSLLERGLAATTVNHYMSAVKFASRRLAQLARDERADFARWAERPPSRREPNDTSLTREEVARLLRACRGDRPVDLRDRALVLVGISGGFRRAELARLEWDKVRPFEVRLEDGSSVIAALLEVRVKGGKVIQQAISSEAYEALAVWRAWLDERDPGGNVFRGLRPVVEGGVRPTASLSPSQVWRIINGRGAVVGLPEIHPHALRHTHASLAVAAGVEGWRVQKGLGHTRLDMTFHYTEDLAKERVAEQIGRLDTEE